MSYSVDDLVASLNASHVGQDQMDLQALQAQLSSTLLYQQQQQAAWGQATSSAAGYAPCNTPTARTPSTSFANWPGLEHQHRRARSGSSAGGRSRRNTLTTSYDEHEREMRIAEEDMEADDELAVEQLVDSGSAAYSGASSPMRFRPDASASHFHQQTHAHAHQTHNAFVPSSPVSSFAATDPFFAAAEAASRQAHHAAQNNFFAQYGRPAQHSPFFAPHASYVAAGAGDA